MDMLMAFRLGDTELEIVEAIEKIFSYALNMAVGLLGKDPKAFAGELGAWDIITGINSKIIPVACALLTLFFLIGFCENSINVKEELNLELCIKLFIRIGIAEYFVINSIDIVIALFEFTTGLSKFSMADLESFEYTTIGIGGDIEATTNTGRIVLLFILAIFFMVAVACSAVIIITVYMRFFKILIAIPYGTFAFSTVSSGSHWLNGTVSAFIKYMLSALLEAFSMGIALKIGIGIISHGGVLKVYNLISEFSFTPFSSALVRISGSVVDLLMLVMILRTSQKIAGRVLALDR